MFEKSSQFLNYMMHDFGGGPKVINLRWVINIFKGMTPLYAMVLMWYYQNFSLGAYLYYALHGSYGILWVVKDLVFGDKNWDKKITILSAICSGLFLILYWSIGWVQISGRGINEPTNGRTVTAVIMYIFGVNMMLVSDAQKYYTLKYKRGLIDEGMFAFTRNPNYLGEILLYASFAVLTGNSYCYSLLICVWITIFNINMQMKDKSFKQKQGWENYSKRSGLLLPRIYSSRTISLAVYGALGAFLYYDYSQGGLIQQLKVE